MNIVKTKSKCLRIWAWIFIVIGVINVAANVLLIIGLDSASQIGYLDSNGDMQVFYLDKGPLFLSGLIKIVSGALSIYIGRKTLKLTKPILDNLQRYTLTRGMQMTERKSTDVEAFLKVLKKIIWISIIVMIVTLIASDGVLKDTSHRFLDQYYSTKNSTNDAMEMSLITYVNSGQQKLIDLLKDVDQTRAQAEIDSYIGLVMRSTIIFTVLIGGGLMYWYYTSLKAVANG